MQQGFGRTVVGNYADNGNRNNVPTTPARPERNIPPTRVGMVDDVEIGAKTIPDGIKAVEAIDPRALTEADIHKAGTIEELLQMASTKEYLKRPANTELGVTEKVYEAKRLVKAMQGLRDLALKGTNPLDPSSIEGLARNMGISDAGQLRWKFVALLVSEWAATQIDKKLLTKQDIRASLEPLSQYSTSEKAQMVDRAMNGLMTARFAKATSFEALKTALEPVDGLRNERGNEYTKAFLLETLTQAQALVKAEQYQAALNLLRSGTVTSACGFRQAIERVVLQEEDYMMKKKNTLLPIKDRLEAAKSFEDIDLMLKTTNGISGSQYYNPRQVEEMVRRVKEAVQSGDREKIQLSLRGVTSGEGLRAALERVVGVSV